MRKSAAGAAVLLLAACASNHVRFYKGAERLPTELAFLRVEKGVGDSELRARVYKIDGRLVVGDLVAEILPGAHKVEVQWQLTDKQIVWGGIGLDVLWVAALPLWILARGAPAPAPVTKHDLHQVGRTTLSLNAGAGHTYELAWMETGPYYRRQYISERI